MQLMLIKSLPKKIQDSLEKVVGLSTMDWTTFVTDHMERYKKKKQKEEEEDQKQLSYTADKTKQERKRKFDGPTCSYCTHQQPP